MCQLLTDEEQVLEKLTPKFKFTSNWFAGIIEILSVDKEKNILNVEIESMHGHPSREEWNLQHTVWGFIRQDYWPVIVR